MRHTKKEEKDRRGDKKTKGLKKIHIVWPVYAMCWVRQDKTRRQYMWFLLLPYSSEFIEPLPHLEEKCAKKVEKRENTMMMMITIMKIIIYVDTNDNSNMS